MMRIKWQNPQQQGRVHKRSRTATTTAEKQQYYKKRRLYNKNKTNGSSSSSSSKDLNELENKVTYSLDSLATITVMYNSLKHAYDNSKPELDQTSTATRLGEMERELLTAYDDLGLQVRHLARDMSKLEKQIKEISNGGAAATVAMTTVVNNNNNNNNNNSNCGNHSNGTPSPGTPPLVLDDGNYSPPLALPFEATPPPVYYVPAAAAAAAPSLQSTTATAVPEAWSCDPVYGCFPAPPLITHNNAPCACAECSSCNNACWTGPSLL